MIEGCAVSLLKLDVATWSANERCWPHVRAGHTPSGFPRFA